jgi:starch synthase (maltosyl-transferring)
MEVAIDLAFQCSRDHPYIKTHPEWFRWRPDGSIQYAENPPKKYQDVVPFNFETDHWEELWEELKNVTSFWVDQGIRIFRVDNPHTKPFPFWSWLIKEIRKDNPDIIFLAEAFTRPKVMRRLAREGFAQSYTYFTWRNSKHEIQEYLLELTQTELAEYFQPNFWPNTPDILPEFLQIGGRPAFVIRLVLAATLSSCYGIYGPVYELMIADALPGREEYLNSEKYEIRDWDWDKPGNLKDFISRLNAIRRENKALQTTRNLNFLKTDNDNVVFYLKESTDGDNVLLTGVSLDPFSSQECRVNLPLEELGIDPTQAYLLHDLLGDEKHICQGGRITFEFDPAVLPARVFSIHRRLRREEDFDYFM